jgi:hypothetical protein
MNIVQGGPQPVVVTPPAVEVRREEALKQPVREKEVQPAAASAASAGKSRYAERKADNERGARFDREV